MGFFQAGSPCNECFRAEVIVLVLGLAACAGPSPTESWKGENTDTDTGIDACGDDPFVSVEVGYTALCGTHADGCVECADARTPATMADPPRRDLVSVSIAESCLAEGYDVCHGPVGACGVDPDGAPACWGWPYGDLGLAEPPAAVASLSAGYQHACGLDSDGMVTCWGACEQDSCSAPEGAFTTVVAGDDFSCALAGDGSATCWGSPVWTDESTWKHGLALWAAGPFVGLYAVPEGPCGRDVGGSVLCFSYDFGSTYAPFEAPDASASWAVVPVDGIGWPDQVCALTADGSATCSDEPRSIPIELLAGYTFTVISSTSDHLCGVTTGGEVVCAAPSAARAYCPFCTELYEE